MSNYSHGLKIVNRLVANGHIAYFAGGWVRDFVMKKNSDDIDIATSATPEQILDLFPNTLLVGIQFGVVVVLIEGHAYEVATFRKDLEYKNGRKPEKIEKASPRIDAERRDFTINGMFYDPVEDKIHDYVGGMEDIEKGIVRAIGNPYDRFFEDKLRMMRAFRFAARFNFHLEQETAKAIEENAQGLFPSVAMERIWQEFCKMSDYPRFNRALVEMHRLKLLPVIFQDLEKVPLHDLEKRLSPLEYYPKEAPKTLFLAELFPDRPKEFFINLGKYLKASNREIESLLFYHDNIPYDLRLTRFESCRFYAHPEAIIALKAYSARLPRNEGKNFLQAHEEKIKSLTSHIIRLKNKTPLLSSQDLIKAGIKPGILMGQLLIEGERIAIEQNLQDSSAILNQLKRLPLWSSC